MCETEETGAPLYRNSRDLGLRHQTARPRGRVTHVKLWCIDSSSRGRHSFVH